MYKNYIAATSLLDGSTIAAPDRRTGSAPAIPFIQLREPGQIVLVPEYGTSDEMRKALTKLANEVTFQPKPGSKTRRPMPHYHFNVRSGVFMLSNVKK